MQPHIGSIQCCFVVHFMCILNLFLLCCTIKLIVDTITHCALFIDCCYMCDVFLHSFIQKRALLFSLCSRGLKTTPKYLLINYFNRETYFSFVLETWCSKLDFSSLNPPTPKKALHIVFFFFNKQFVNSVLFIVTL